MSWADAFAKDDGRHQEPENGQPSGAPALQAADRHGVAVCRNERDSQRQSSAGKQQPQARAPCAGAEPLLREERDRGKYPGGEQDPEVIRRVGQERGSEQKEDSADRAGVAVAPGKHQRRSQGDAREQHHQGFVQRLPGRRGPQQ